MRLIPTPAEASRAAANAYDMVFGGGLADLRRTPASIISEAPQCTLFRYLPPEGGRAPTRDLPVLLVPPLAAPPICFDLRRGCSLVEHLLAAGHPTYLVDYGRIGFSDRELGLEHWIEDVIPRAIRDVSADAGGRPVQLVGWCLGGIMALLSVAADPALPVDRIAAVGSPFDAAQVGLLKTLGPGDALRAASACWIRCTASWAVRPRRWCAAPSSSTSIDKELTKPVSRLRHLDDREFLAQIEAVDHFTRHMHAYPGRTFGQLYHRFFRVNDLADGRFALARSRHRPRRRDRARAVDRRRPGRDRPRGRGPPCRVAAAQRRRGAPRGRSRRPPRRARRARRAGDHVGVDRPLLRRARRRRAPGAPTRRRLSALTCRRARNCRRAAAGSLP